MTPISIDRLLPGLGDPVLDSQRVFRAALEAFSQPGRWVALPLTLDAPAPLAPATAAFLLTMSDYETPVWLQQADEAVAEYLRFHCGAPIAPAPGDARFAVVTNPRSMPSLHAFQIGEPEYPERSTTIIVQVPRGLAEHAARLTGPGIREAVALDVVGLRSDFWREWQRNDALFPCGVDVMFTCGDALCALPRTVKAEL